MKTATMERETDFWLDKARALLWPSPFWQQSLDHGPDEHGRLERERLERLERVLGSGDRERIATAMRDAHDAHVPPIAAAGTWCRRKHPLDGDRELETAAAQDWFEREVELAGLAEKVSQAGDATGARDAYARLWQRAMKTGDDMPGSFVVPDHSVAALRSMTAALAGARANNGRAALLRIHVAPVQGFIRASRRTHDLWVGSFTIGYLTMQAIAAIARAEGPDAIVYPDLAELPLARKLLFAESAPEGSEADFLRSSLANQFLAVVALENAEALVTCAQASIDETWTDMAWQARTAIDEAVARGKMKGQDMWSGFEDQIAGHLEFDAVVLPWPANREALVGLLDDFGIPERERPWLPEERESDRTGGGYGALFDLCHRTLAAYRKTTMPAISSGDGRPKCSQCGQREQMVPRNESLESCRRFNQELSRALSGPDKDQPRISHQLARGEGLCAVCWTKRMAPEQFFGNRDQKLELDWMNEGDRKRLRFPSVVTVASAPFRYRLLNPAREFWQGEDALGLPGRLENWQAKLEKVLARCALDYTPPRNMLYGLQKQHCDSRLRAVAPTVLDHDGEWFYDSNYEPETAWRNYFAGDHLSRQDKKRFEKLKSQLRPARKAMAAVHRVAGFRATSYYAVLVVDGDDMGKWLTGRHDDTPLLAAMLTDTELAQNIADDRKRPLYPALHRELARRLGRLALRLHTIVDDHLGRMVYSGGDDVMAFLPLATALPCARAIERALRAELGDRVTASAGLAIAHRRMPLSRTLDHARQAEKQSKDSGKSRLTVHVAKRSGAPVALTLPWRIAKNDTIATLIEVLRRDERDRESRPLARVDVAYRLEQEFRVLFGYGQDTTENRQGSPTVDAMLRERMRTLLGTGQRVKQLLACIEQLGGAKGMNLLLLLRFLMREEHGIDTVNLLEDLGVWPGTDREERP